MTTSEDRYEKVEDRVESFNISDSLSAISTAGKAASATAPLQAILNVLEPLTMVHPFVAVALLPFKAVVSLELSRRQNDRRAMVLISQMADLLRHFARLRDIELDSFHKAELSTLTGSIAVSVISFASKLNRTLIPSNRTTLMHVEMP